MQARVVIIGGGVMGVAIAWHCALRADPIEEPVVLLEKEQLGAGSSGRSGAILRQHYSDPELACMARDSLRVYADFELRTGRSIAFQRTGVVTLAGPAQPELLARVERNIVMQRALGIDTQRLEAPALRALVPGLSIGDGVIGAFEPGAGGVDPLRTVEAFAAVAREHGAITRVGVRALELVVERGRVRGVETDHGRIACEQVVVATGPWSRAFLRTAGIELPLRVVTPEQHFLRMPATAARTTTDANETLADALLDRFGLPRNALPPAPHPTLLDVELGFYTRCEAHAARTRVGRMDYTFDAELEDPDQLDQHVNPQFRSWARAVLEQRLPVYRAEPDAGALKGLYTLSPDAQALIGPRRELEGLFVVTGFSGHGFKLAPSVGAGVAQMLWGEPVSAFDARFFDAHRFDGKPEMLPSGAFGL
jgi:sarcosine oxidase, subunit beta